MCKRNKNLQLTLMLLGALGSAEEIFMVNNEISITNNESAKAFITPINKTSVERNSLVSLLKRAPKIVRITSRSCVIRVEDFELIEGSKTPSHFKIQYKKNLVDNSWKTLGESYIFNLTSEISIEYFEADTTYCIRVVLYSSEENIYLGDAIRTVCFNTTCIPLRSEDIRVVTTSTSATVRFVKKKDMCKIYNYKYKLDNGEEKELINYTIELSNLEPYKTYTFNLQHRENTQITQIQFTTKRGVQNKLKSVTVWSVSGKHISLRWNPPTGNLTEYKYKILYGIEHPYFLREKYATLYTPIVTCKLWPDDHCVTIKNTTEDVVYEIKIYARNSDLQDFAPIYNISVHTIVTKSDPPYNVSTIWTDDGDLLISWTHPNFISGTSIVFIIKTKHNTSFTYKIKSEDEYNITYRYLIKRNNFTSCSDYVLNVIIENEKYHSDTNYITVTIPPPLISNINRSNITVSCTNKITYIKIPKVQYYQSCTNNCDKKMYVLFSSAIYKKGVKTEINDFENALRINNPMLHLNYTKILLERDQEELPLRISVNNDTKNCNINPLDELDLYIFFVNQCKTRDHNIILKRIDMNPSNPLIFGEEHNVGLYTLLLFVLLIPVGIYLYKSQKCFCSFTCQIGNPDTQGNIPMDILNKR